MLNQKVFNAEVEEFIRYMVAWDEFRSFVQEKLEEKVAEFEEAMKDIIDLAFPVYYGECKGTRIRMPEENTVETVVFLSKLNAKQHIEV